MVQPLLSALIPNVILRCLHYVHRTEDLETQRYVRHGHCLHGDSTQNIHEASNHLMAGVLSYSVHLSFAVANTLLE